MFITFIYRIGNNRKTYYGKYVFDYISDDHEGLDCEVSSAVVYGINKFREHKGLSELKKKVSIGVLSFSSNRIIPTWSSDDEIQCFDFYCKRINNKDKVYVYVNGERIKSRCSS